MIESKTGVLTFSQPAVEIGPTLTRSQFQASPWSKEWEDLVVNEPWHSWRSVKPYQSMSISFAIHLFFHGERLHSVTLGDADPRFGIAWNDWSLEKELKRKASHDEWLEKNLGGGRSYSWGSIISVYDDKAGGSSIRVTY